MNLRGIANSVSSQVNPNVSATIRRSTGYTIGAGLKQVPTYSDTSGMVQVQALDGGDLRQLDGLNITGTLRAVYLSGNLAGVIKPESKGGDLIVMGGQTWLVVKVLEHWPTWTKAAICLQA